ncbi:hypothetical protein PR202_gb07701 [Eleusine coracana subsp. coracana]|uniref:Alcohol dehydrogenase-like C-terminal domain-containing protein n=1 Tax=Eleusine coracana subsp. coracana TaxID=191504 RepID=A0AAV5EDM2_ELECO|nr:hypothetical protein PR202_gb07701 [Eleusine coracana subsp. coracana]
MSVMVVSSLALLICLTLEKVRSSWRTYSRNSLRYLSREAMEAVVEDDGEDMVVMARIRAVSEYQVLCANLGEGGDDEAGKEMGITDFINSMTCGKPVHEVIREMTDGGVDYSFECTGINDVLREAFVSTHDGWGLTVVLGIHATPKMMPLHPMELFDGRRITGCVFGDFKGKSELPELVDKCMNGEVKINFDGFITHKMPFSDINKAFELLLEGKSLRCLLNL